MYGKGVKVLAEVFPYTMDTTSFDIPIWKLKACTSNFVT